MAGREITRYRTGTYTVRIPGHAAWSGPGLTARQAIQDFHAARGTGLAVRIYADERPRLEFDLAELTWVVWEEDSDG